MFKSFILLLTFYPLFKLSHPDKLRFELLIAVSCKQAPRPKCLINILNLNLGSLFEMLVKHSIWYFMFAFGLFWLLPKPLIDDLCLGQLQGSIHHGSFPCLQLCFLYNCQGEGQSHREFVIHSFSLLSMGNIDSLDYILVQNLDGFPKPVRNKFKAFQEGVIS